MTMQDEAVRVSPRLLERVINLYRTDPASLDPATRAVLDSIAATEPETVDRNGKVQVAVSTLAAIAQLTEAIRQYGARVVQLDPLGDIPAEEKQLRTDYYGLSDADLAAAPASAVRTAGSGSFASAADAINALRAAYTSRVGFEFTHLTSPVERHWFEDAVENGRFTPGLEQEDAIAVLKRLTQVESFERTLHRVFVGQKRFSIEGLDVMVPMLDTIAADAAERGTPNVILGMAHRGRLATRTWLTGISFSVLFHAFRAAMATGDAVGDDPGDVKYHLGATGNSGLIEDGPTVYLRPNPSHLEFVNPVVLGFARALQEDMTVAGAPPIDVRNALPVVIHGDAAFPGEGVVAESMNIAELKGYTAGGAIHIIANNQIGFTTNPTDGRSSRFSSDVAKGYNIPIIHVNADDVESCIAVTRLACAFREEFHRDVLIDLVGYRRWGHNEGDEPAYTQPVRYKNVAKHPTVREIWAKDLERREWIPSGEGDTILKAIDAELMKSTETNDDHHGAAPAIARPAYIETGVPQDLLSALNAELIKRPDGFVPQSKLEQQLRRTRGDLDASKPLDWGHTESLAFASILAEGTPIRVTGQDAQRGTFSHRHAVIHDETNDENYVPLQHLPHAKASFSIYNSPLAEVAAMGFEFGYSQAAPNALVIWEAQFGDFANVAQVIIDQFIAAANAKWHESTGLVLLLPHGYEGQGPEHSSARVERYLQLFAENNMQICMCSSADQYFHLLRQHAARIRKGDVQPLVVFSPKSLLRSPLAAARVDQLTSGGFRAVLDDPTSAGRENDVTRLVLCTGKIGVELLNHPRRAETKHIAIARVEQLAPWPTSDIARLLSKYKYLEEIVWAQEEPQNMGAAAFAMQRIFLQAAKGVQVRYIGRREKASPSEGSQAVHNVEQARIHTAVFAD